MEKTFTIAREDEETWCTIDALLHGMKSPDMSNLVSEGLKKEIEQRLSESIKEMPPGLIEYTYRDYHHIRRTVIFKGKWIVFKLRTTDEYFGKDCYSVALTATGKIIVFHYGDRIDAEDYDVHDTFESFASDWYPDWMILQVADIMYPDCVEVLDI